MFISKIPPEPPKAASPQPNKATMQKACKRSQTNCCYHVNKKLLLCLTSFSLAGRYFSYWKSLKPAPNTTVKFFFFLKRWLGDGIFRAGRVWLVPRVSVCLSVFLSGNKDPTRITLRWNPHPVLLQLLRRTKIALSFILFFSSFPLGVWLLSSFFSFFFFLQVLYII